MEIGWLCKAICSLRRHSSGVTAILCLSPFGSNCSPTSEFMEFQLPYQLLPERLDELLVPGLVGGSHGTLSIVDLALELPHSLGKV